MMTNQDLIEELQKEKPTETVCLVFNGEAYYIREVCHDVEFAGCIELVADMP